MVSSEVAELNQDYIKQMSMVQKLNFATIAKVCNTDAQTVELVIKEVLAQIVKFVKDGFGVRISFRIGRIEIKGAEINWKQFSDDYDRNARSFTTMKDFDSKQQRSITNSRYSKHYATSRKCS